MSAAAFQLFYVYYLKYRRNVNTVNNEMANELRTPNVCSGIFLDTKNIRIKILTEKMDFNEMASIKEETARSFVSGRYSSGYVS